MNVNNKRFNDIVRLLLLCCFWLCYFIMALQAFFPKLFFITMRFGGQAPLLLMKSNTCISKLFPRKKVVVVVQKVSHSSGIFRIYYNIAKQHLVANLKGPKFFNGLFHFCFFPLFQWRNTGTSVTGKKRYPWKR